MSNKQKHQAGNLDWLIPFGVSSVCGYARIGDATHISGSMTLELHITVITPPLGQVGKGVRIKQQAKISRGFDCLLPLQF